MAQSDTYEDGDRPVDTSARVGWFAAGALVAALLVALFLYADGYFDEALTLDVQADTPEHIIEAY